MSPPSVALSVVLPAFNEEALLAGCVRQLHSALGALGVPAEIIVVDDGSRDGTAALAESYAGRGVRLVRLPANRGKGAALRAGVAVSTGEMVLISDADFSTPVEEVDRLAARLDAAEIALGSRAVGDSRITVHQPPWRELAGKGFNLLIRLLGVGGIRDSQCGFKLLRGEVARELFAAMTIDRYAFDVELILLARRRGYRVVEVGVEWRDDPASRVRVLRDGPRMLADVVRLRRRLRAADRRARAAERSG
jgi:dolichyl-phosphate beta-glucosyltransferase